MRVDDANYASAALQIETWAQKAESRFVCIANVHMVMQAYDDPEFRAVVNSADLVTPDGMPLVWMLRRLGHPGQARVYGPDLTLHVLEAAARRGAPVGFYGSTAETLERLEKIYLVRFPGLKINYRFSPPFRLLSPQEDSRVVDDINASGIRILFVGLGCPKQERWMAAHKGQIHAVMLGVGAAFEFHAKTRRQAPAWVQRMGLEWLFRFSQEPARLWWRYIYHNPRFVILSLMQLLRRKA